MANPLVLKVVNVLAYIFLLGSNAYTSWMPDYGDSQSHAGKVTYITPASYAFYVWTIINLLLLGEVIVQFFSGPAAELLIDHIGWRFAGIAILNAVYAHLYASGHYVLAFICVLFLASAISTVYWSLRSHPPSETSTTVFVHLPWSLWHAWSVVLVLVSGFAAFGRSTHHHAGVWTDMFVCAGLAFLVLTSVGYAYHGDKGDVGGAAVLAWALWGIFSAHVHPQVIHWFALGSAILATLAVAKALYSAFTGGRGGVLADSERAPLLSGE